MSITFLTIDEVLALHADQIERYGGRPGVRDVALLRAALAVPAATFGGLFLHETVDEMGAAYLFHVARNHPFIDGSKRTALIAMLAFLGLNGFQVVAPADEVFDVVVGIAEGRTSKAEAAVFIQKHRARRRGILPGEDRP